MMNLFFELTQEEAEWLLRAVQELPMKVGVPLTQKLKSQAFEQIQEMMALNRSLQEIQKTKKE